MSFDSLGFLLFLPLAFAVHWMIPSRRIALRNVFLTLVSYGFYSWFDIRFSAILIVVTLLTYVMGKTILAWRETSESRARALVVAHIVLSVGTLGLFKYLDFFSENVVALLSLMGMQADGITLKLILPVGLSFYLFMAMSYVIDCYKGVIEKNPSLLMFTTYLSFFPHLVAGPVDRGRLIMPQLESHRTFDHRLAVAGMRQLLYGYFKKLVIADNLGMIVAVVWGNYDHQNSLIILFGMVLYSIQIYADFSGYSDMAIGVGKLFGIRMMRNFANPYFARTVSEFWRGWHISLTSWFTEYLYIPLGGNRLGVGRTIANTVVVFTLCGLWHGANWTFVVWGFLNGLLFIPLLMSATAKQHWKATPLRLDLENVLHIALVFFGITVTWVFFRSSDLSQALGILYHLVVNVGEPMVLGMVAVTMVPIFYVVLLSFIVLEWRGRNQEFALDYVSGRPIALRWGSYLLLFMAICFFVQSSAGQFIYQNF